MPISKLFFVSFSEISIDVSGEDIVKSAVNENETEKQEIVAEAKKAIEIDYDFGENDKNGMKTLKELLPLYSNVKPCLKGSINGVINLDGDDEKPSKSGGDELLERFIKHVAKKPNRSAQEMR